VAGGQPALQDKLNAILNDMKHQDAQAGHVHFVGAGPGDPELLTLKARKLLHEADMVIHDRLVSNAILELARREATMIEVGKIPFGPSWKQADINALLVKHGQNAQIVRLKSGDCGIFGRLDEEIEALEKAQIDYTITPGVTSAAAAAAGAKLSLTNRHRAPELRIITGHQANGFAAQDWRALAKPSAVAAIYMGKAAAGFMRGRLLMHGADPATPVTIVENASRTDQRIIAATLLTFDQKIKDIAGPAVILLGLARRRANTVQLQKAL
jgi:uroporphyrin-III C-methyltransferase/precorrin-2 dehydrogenase/sirohydrochlorin ferrochelatase